MKNERSLILSDRDIRAIFLGTKTQVRTIVKPRPRYSESHKSWMWQNGPDSYDLPYSMTRTTNKLTGVTTTEECKLDLEDWLVKSGRCPYKVGMKLWVKETWKPGSWNELGNVAIDYRATPEIVKTPYINVSGEPNFNNMWQKWTNELIKAGSMPDADGIHRWEPGKSPLKWRSSAMMPRWASRITLEITEVRAQQVQNITREDAIAEGIEEVPQCGILRCAGWKNYGEGVAGFLDPIKSYDSLFDSTYGIGAFGLNEIVWAVTFKVV